jgi:hypothetical protein
MDSSRALSRLDDFTLTNGERDAELSIEDASTDVELFVVMLGSSVTAANITTSKREESASDCAT